MGAPEGNKYAIGNEGGREPFFSNPEEFKQKVEEYFENSQYKETPSENPGEPPTINRGYNITITGLAYYLGFQSRQSFYDYEQKKEFAYVIKRARLMVESCYEDSLYGRNPTGSIFALKNMGWKDTSEIKHEIQKSFLNLDPLADDQTNQGAKEDSPA